MAEKNQDHTTQNGVDHETKLNTWFFRAEVYAAVLKHQPRLQPHANGLTENVVLTTNGGNELLLGRIVTGEILEDSGNYVGVKPKSSPKLNFWKVYYIDETAGVVRKNVVDLEGIAEPTQEKEDAEPSLDDRLEIDNAVDGVLIETKLGLQSTVVEKDELDELFSELKTATVKS